MSPTIHNPADAESSAPTLTSGSLYVVATPIGNLSDLSQRAKDVLCQARWVAAEDTRVSRVLLDRIGSTARMIPVHQHNEQASAARLIERLKAGEDIALITDAGTPAISDPGSSVVAAARAQGITVIPIPGACAPVTLLSASGLPPSPFLFEGFLPPKEKARLDRLRELRRCADLIGAHIVLFEAPHRIERTLASIVQSHGEHRSLVIGRELTKKFEEIHACPAGAAPAWIDERPERLKGEFVIAIGAPVRAPRPDGAAEAAAEQASGGPPADADVSVEDAASDVCLPSLGLWPIGASTLGDPAALLTRLLQDLPPSRAVKLAQELTGLAHRELYSLALTLRKEPL